MSINFINCRIRKLLESEGKFCWFPERECFEFSVYDNNVLTKHSLSYKPGNYQALLKMVKENKIGDLTVKNIIVDRYNWDSNIFSYKNLDEQEKYSISKDSKLREDYGNPSIQRIKKFYVIGKLEVDRKIHELLFLMYVLDTESFLDKLYSLNLTRKIMREYLINAETILPLNENYKNLIKHVFDDSSISEYIMFRSELSFLRFTESDLVQILKMYNFDLDDVFYELYEGIHSTELLIDYLNSVIDLKSELPNTDTHYFNPEDSSTERFAGLIILLIDTSQLDVDSEAYKSYIRLMKKYIDIGGHYNIKILNVKNFKMYEEKLKDRLNSISI